MGQFTCYGTMDPEQHEGKGHRRADGGGRRRGRRQIVSDEIWATLVDHVFVHRCQ